jgi:rod shape determining protein RodA
LRSYGFFIYLFGASLLLLVLLFGHTVRSTQGWFRLGGLSFQPVEIAKVTLVIYLAALFVRSGYERLTWHIFGLGAAATFIYVILILLQPDFGSAMLLLVIWGGLSLFAGLPRRAWIILPVVVLTVGALVWAVGLKPYQRERVLSFLNPQTDTRGANYNALQARIAIGSGGWLGKGIGEGSQARLRFLPEAATDFLFAVLGEELGFVGVSVILGLFLLLLYRCIRLAQEAADDFAALLLIGLGAIVLVQLMVNAGMNLGIMPITGIPLPFISAAASSLVVAYVSIGIAESVAVRRRGAVAEEAS